MKKKLFSFTVLPVALMIVLSLLVSPSLRAGDCKTVGGTETWIKEFPANILGTSSIVLWPEGDIITPDQKIKSYSGFARVTKEETGHDYESYMYYWFFESRTTHLVKKEKKKNIPLLIWLSGGPGASSMLGCFQENGPYRMQVDDTATIVENPYSWSRECHMIFWDNPVGTGYSHSIPAGHYAKSEEDLSTQLYFAMQRFYKRHPEYRKCPLYVTGESYGGKYVPHVARKIMEMNEKKIHPPINLKGISIGDGWIEPFLHLQNEIDYAYNLGFIDTLQKQRIEDLLEQAKGYRKSKDFFQAYKLGNMIPEILMACGGNFSFYDVRSFSGTPVDYIKAYFRSEKIKNALGVPCCVEWNMADNAGPVADCLAEDVFNERRAYKDLNKLINNNVRILCYTGNFDMACGFRGTETILRDLKWNRAKDWINLKREVWVDPHVRTLGFVKYIKDGVKENYRLMQVNIVGAGHMVPAYKPQASRDMIYNFIFDREFISYDPLANLDKEVDKCVNSESTCK